MTVTNAQIKVLDSLITCEGTLARLATSTKHLLIEKGLINLQGLVTQEGLKHVTIPVMDVDVIIFGSDVTYNHPIGKGKYTSLTFPSGTEMIATFPIEAKGRMYYEGMVSVNGKPLWVRIAHSPRFKFVKRLMPMKDGANG